MTLVRNFRRIISSAYSLSVVFNIKSSELRYFFSWARMAGPFLSASASCSLPLLSVAMYSVVNLKLLGMHWLGIGLKVRSWQTFCGAPAKPETCKRKKTELGKREAWLMSWGSHKEDFELLKFQRLRQLLLVVQKWEGPWSGPATHLTGTKLAVLSLRGSLLFFVLFFCRRFLFRFWLNSVIWKPFPLAEHLVTCAFATYLICVRVIATFPNPIGF